MRPLLRTGRNSPCLCGSGRKFKHCHGRSSAVFSRMGSAPGKASARLLEVADLLLDDSDLDDDEFLARLRLTMLAWNIAVLEADADDSAELRAKIRELGMEPAVDELARKKVKLFPDDMRHLLDVIVTKNHCGERYVQVVSVT